MNKLNEAQIRFLWVVLFALLGLRLLIVVQVPIMDSTESRYAEIARKMVETADWITPQFEYGVPFWAKPPLHSWISALGILLFGVNEFGARIFIYVTACGLITLLYRWARDIRGQDFALMGSVALVSSGIFFSTMAAVMTDLVMLFGVALSMVSYWRAVESDTPSRFDGTLFFIGLSIGLLAKGPIAVVLTGLPIGAWVLLRHRWSAVWLRLPWIKGSLLLLVLVAPWYLAAELKTPGFLRYFFIGEHFERYLNPNWSGDLYGGGHGRPYGTIWLYWLGGSLPWSLFLLVPLIRFRTVLRQGWIHLDPWRLYLMIWTCAPMLFFTFSSNIIRTYVLTSLPAFCFLSIELLYLFADRDRKRYLWMVRTFQFLSLCAMGTFVCNYVTYTYLHEWSPRKTQKWVAREIHKRSIESEVPVTVVYYQERLFSGEFYSNGHYKNASSLASLQSVLSDSDANYIVMRLRAYQEIPEVIQEALVEVQSFGRYILYEEKSTPVISTL